jgi:hypothetical protein
MQKRWVRLKIFSKKLRFKWTLSDCANSILYNLWSPEAEGATTVKTLLHVFISETRCVVNATNIPARSQSFNAIYLIFSKFKGDIGQKWLH